MPCSNAGHFSFTKHLYNIMYLHLTADTANTFVMPVLRENSLLFTAQTSYYAMVLKDLQRNTTKTVLLSDLSPMSQSFNSFVLTISGTGEDLQASIIDLGIGDHSYKLYNLSAATTADIVSDCLYAGWMKVHSTSGTDPVTSFNNNDDTTIAFE